MTQPTDEELDALLCEHWPAFDTIRPLARLFLRNAMRAAVAKWGAAPQQAAPAGRRCDNPHGVERPEGVAEFVHDNSVSHGGTAYYCAKCGEHMGDVDLPKNVPLRKYAVCYKCQEAAPQQAAPAVPSNASDILSKVCDLFGIGKAARKESTILANVENAIRHAGLLHALERDLFPQPELPEDDDPYATVDDELPAPSSWGAKDETDYVSQFRAALLARGFAAPQQAAPVDEKVDPRPTWNQAPCVHCGRPEGRHFLDRCHHIQGDTRYTPAPQKEAPDMEEAQCRSEPSEWVPPAGDYDGSVASMALSDAKLRAIAALQEPKVPLHHEVVNFARAVEAEVRKDCDALIRQMLELLQAMRDAAIAHADGYVWDAYDKTIAAARAWLEGKE